MCRLKAPNDQARHRWDHSWIATEALAKLQKGKGFEPATEKAVKACIDDADRDQTDREIVLVQKVHLARSSYNLLNADSLFSIGQRSLEPSKACRELLRLIGSTFQ
jgi:hypothetical protein